MYNFVHMSKFLYINVNMSREGGLIIVHFFCVYVYPQSIFFWLNVRLPFVAFLNNNKKKRTLPRIPMVRFKNINRHIYVNLIVKCVF